MALTDLQEEAVEKMAKADKLSPVEVGEAEDELSGWLDDHGVDDAWDLAPALVAAGVDTEWLDDVAESVPNDATWRCPALGHLCVGDQAAHGGDRGLDGCISALVGAAKQYSQLDRAAHQYIDVRDGLKSTLIMLMRQDQRTRKHHRIAVRELRATAASSPRQSRLRRDRSRHGTQPQPCLRPATGQTHQDSRASPPPSGALIDPGPP